METDGSFCGISILAVLADRNERRIPTRVPRRISILAVLADRDRSDGGFFFKSLWISILAVLADRDSFSAFLRSGNLAFQSSQSLRTATLVGGQAINCLVISILAVLADRDRSSSMRMGATKPFQSSRSLRTATNR